MNINNLGEYSDLYLKTDVLLLDYIFEQFRFSSHKTYGIDSAHYYTLPVIYLGYNAKAYRHTVRITYIY